METKYCKCCDIDLDISFFGFSYDKKYNKKRVRSHCKECINRKALIRENTLKTLTPKLYKIRNKKNHLKALIKNPNLNKERYLRNKNNPNYISYNVNYKKENKDLISENRKDYDKQWHERQKYKLTDSYCINRIMCHSNLSRKEILQNPQLIETKRLTILLKREHKNQQNGK